MNTTMTQINEVEISNSEGECLKFVNFNFLKLQTDGSQRRYMKEVYRDAAILIHKICKILNIRDEICNDAIRMYKRIWQRLEPGRKSRAVHFLVPVVVYRTSRFKKHHLKLEELLDVSKCKERDFKEVFIDTYHLFPTVNRKKVVLEIIKKICEEQKVSDRISRQSLWFFLKNQQILLSTTASVAACASFIAPVLAGGLKKMYPTYKIGRQYDASPSAISARIIRVLKSQGFEIKMEHKNTDLISILQSYFKKYRKL